MLLMVYVQDALAPGIRDVRTDAQGTGIMGVMGNKGGVTIRFRLHDSTLCFTNSHLAAHDDAVARRNQDHAEILRRTLLAPATPGDRPATLLQHECGGRVCVMAGACVCDGGGLCVCDGGGRH